MANLSSLFGSAFKPAEVEEVNTDFSPLPKGLYPIQITESEVTPNKSGTGSNLTLKLQVIDGKYKNRIVFDTLCVQHQNATAQAIAQTRLKQICDSLLVKQLKDTIQLHDKTLMVMLDVELDKYQTEKAMGEKVYRNQVKGYSPAISPAEMVTTEDDYEDDIPF